MTTWPRDERLRRHHRLRRRVDFLRCYRKGKKRRGALATLHFHPTDRRYARLGITASRKVGKAVVRHRSKRRIRDIFRRFEDRNALSGMDIVVHLWPSAGRADFSTLRIELERLLASLARGAHSDDGARPRA